MLKLKDIFNIDIPSKGGVKLYKKIMRKYNIPLKDVKEVKQEIEEIGIEKPDIEKPNTGGSNKEEYLYVSVTNFGYWSKVFEVKEAVITYYVTSEITKSVTFSSLINTLSLIKALPSGKVTYVKGFKIVKGLYTQSDGSVVDATSFQSFVDTVGASNYGTITELTEQEYYNLK